VEADYNTSTVALRIIRGDEKEILFQGDINTGTWPSMLMESQIRK
jgi:hypothetical protein